MQCKKICRLYDFRSTALQNFAVHFTSCSANLQADQILKLLLHFFPTVSKLGQGGQNLARSLKKNCSDWTLSFVFHLELDGVTESIQFHVSQWRQPQSAHARQSKHTAAVSASCLVLCKQKIIRKAKYMQLPARREHVGGSRLGGRFAVTTGEV